jgi:hypothetical protein
MLYSILKLLQVNLATKEANAMKDDAQKDLDEVNITIEQPRH